MIVAAAEASDRIMSALFAVILLAIGIRFGVRALADARKSGVARISRGMVRNSGLASSIGGIGLASGFLAIFGREPREGPLIWLWAAPIYGGLLAIMASFLIRRQEVEPSMPERPDRSHAVDHATPTADPGWSPVWNLLPKAFFPPGLRGRSGDDPLITLRLIFTSLVISLFLFLVAFSYISHWNEGEEGWVPWGLVACGVASQLLARGVARRPLITSSLSELAASWRHRFFMQLGLAESTVLFGAIAVIVTGSLWVYLIGLAFRLAGLIWMAPGPKNLARQQQEISSSGSALSLIEALRIPPGGRA